MKTTPTYNLNVVVKETGIKPDTLRAWERRYGLPDPSRTGGGHRLYSERDIATVQWLVDRQGEGLRISHAVDLWKQMIENGQDPLLVKPVGGTLDKNKIPRFEGTPNISELKKRWVNACLRFDEISAENTVNYAFALYPFDTVCFDVLLSGLSEIGDSWYQGEVSVQQEHFASSLVIRRLNALIAATPPPTRSGKILVACPPGEQHTIAPLTISLIMRRRGWVVIYLGANVPMSRFTDTVNTIKPNLVVMTAQQLPSAASLLQCANYLAENKHHLAYGGLIFSQNTSLQEKIPGSYLGDHLNKTADRIEEMIFAPQPIPEIVRSREDYEKELEEYIQVKGSVENQVAKAFSQGNGIVNYIESANQFLSQIIESLIILGDPELMNSEITWIDELVSTEPINQTLLSKYFSEYQKITKQILNNENQIVLSALEKFKINTGDME